MEPPDAGSLQLSIPVAADIAEGGPTAMLSSSVISFVKITNSSVLKGKNNNRINRTFSGTYSLQ